MKFADPQVWSKHFKKAGNIGKISISLQNFVFNDKPFIFVEEGAYPSLRDEKQSEGGLEDLSCPWVRAKQTLLNNRLQFAYYTSTFSRWSERWQGNCLSLWILHVLLCWNFGPCFNIYNRRRRNEALFCCNFPMYFFLKYIGLSHPFSYCQIRVLPFSCEHTGLF